MSSGTNIELNLGGNANGAMLELSKAVEGLKGGLESLDRLNLTGLSGKLESIAWSLGSMVGSMAALDKMGLSGFRAEVATLSTSMASLEKSLPGVANLRAEHTKVVAAQSNLNAETKNGVSHTAALRAEQKAHAATMRDLHGAARGLSGAFGTLWMTYGSILPLLAGAAIGSAFRSVGTMGSEVGNTFELIRVLSEESAQSVGALNAQMLELARTGPFGPKEIAEAMKTLSLAGLSVVEVGAGIKDVLNFAVAGNTTIATAADVLTSVGTAFKIGVEGYNYVADVIAKTAAVSKSSVESIGAAFKTASVINSQYGVSLEDVGLSLAALSNVGIQGVAAGTGLRNTYADLYGRTEKASAALKKLGVDALDSAGNVKPYIQIIGELSTALSKYDARGKSSASRTVFSERGAKDAIESITLFETKAKQAGTTAQNMLEELQQKIAKSTGFVIEAAAQMSLTPLNQMKSVQAALQASLSESFSVIAPRILEISAQMKAVFGSDEFKNAIQGLATALSNLVLVAVKNIEVIGWLAGAYLSLKVAVGAGEFLKLLVAGLSTASVALRATAVSAGVLEAAAVASGAATAGAAAATAGKLGVLATLARFLPGVGIAITAVTTAWSLYSLFATKASGAASTISNNTTLSDFYKKEKTRIDELNEALAMNISLEELRKQKQVQGLQDAAKETGAAGTLRLRAEVIKQEATLLDIQRTSFKWETEKTILQRARVTDAKNALNTHLALEESTRRGALLDKADLMIAQEKNKVLLEAKAKADKLANPSGTQSFTLTDKASTAHSIKDYADNLAAEQRKIDDSAISVLKAQWVNKALVEDAARNNSLENQATYEAKVLERIVKGGQEQVDALKVKFIHEESAYLEAEARLYKEYQTALSDTSKKHTPEGDAKIWDDYSNKVTNVAQAFIALRAVNQDDQTKVQEAATAKYTAELLKLKDALYAVTESARIFYRTEEENLAKINRQTSLDDQLRFASPEARAYLSATSAEMERLTARVLDYDHAIEESTRKIDVLNTKEQTPEIRAVLEAELALREANVAAQEKLNATLPGKANAAGQRNLDKYNKDYMANISGGVAEALMTGLESGAEAGKTKMRDLIVAELRKPIVLAVTAVVNTILGTAVNAVLGGAANAATSGAVEGAAGGVGSTLMSAGLSYGAGALGLAGTGSAFASGFSAGWAGLSPLVATNVATGAAVGGTTATATSLGASAGSALAAIPPVGWIALAVVAAYAIFHKEWVSATDMASTTTSFNSQGTQVSTGGIQGLSHAALADSYIGSLETIYQATAKKWGIGAVDTAFSFAANTGREGKNPNFTLGMTAGGATYQSQTNDANLFAANEVTLSEAHLKQEASRAILLALESSDLPKSIAGFFKSLPDVHTMDQAALDTALSTAQAFADLHTQLQAMPFEYLKDMSYAAAKGLVTAAGGMEQLGSSLGTYYDKFYSAEEKRTQSVKNINATLAAGGVAGFNADNATRDQYKAMVELAGAQDMSVDANARAYTALLSVAGAFDAVTPAAEAAAASVATVNKVLETLASDRKSLEGQLATAQGRPWEAQGVDLSNEAQAKAWDTNESLRSQITAQNAANETIRTNAALADELSVLLGQQAQDQIDLKNGVDATTIALRNQIKAEQARQAAIEKTTATLASLTAKYAPAQTDASASANITAALGLNPSALMGMTGTQVHDWFASLVSGASTLDATNPNIQNWIRLLEQVSPAVDYLSSSLTTSEQAAKTAADALAATNKSWTDQLDVLTGKTTEREQQLGNTADSTTRKYMRQVWAMQDLQKTMAQVESAIAQIHASVTDSIFNMRYGLQDNEGKYAMLDQQAASYDAAMLAAIDITAIASAAQKEIDVINKAWALLDPTQQNDTLEKYEASLARVDAYVTSKGADAVAVKKQEVADLSVAVGAAVEKSIEGLVQQVVDAVLAQAAATAAIGDVVKQPVDVNVNVTAPQGSEVSIS